MGKEGRGKGTGFAHLGISVAAWLQAPGRRTVVLLQGTLMNGACAQEADRAVRTLNTEYTMWAPLRKLFSLSAFSSFNSSCTQSAGL
jgi:hypothetical protein